jgi:hypothetical protein
MQKKPPVWDDFFNSPSIKTWSMKKEERLQTPPSMLKQHSIGTNAMVWHLGVNQSRKILQVTSPIQPKNYILYSQNHCYNTFSGEEYPCLFSLKSLAK